MSSRIQISLAGLLYIIPISSLILLGLHYVSAAGRQCLDDQEALLLAFKDDVSYDPWLSVKIVGWNKSVDDDCCDWGGVTCDRAGHVIGLDLNNETINGGMINESSALFGLGYLQSLNLAHNSFDPGPLPSAFGKKLTLMRHLNLSNSNFEGQVPTSDFSLMTRLVTLDLSSSLSYPYILTLENPDDLRMLIQNFTQLRQLHLNSMTIIIEDHWSEVISSFLPNLEVLSLKGCSLSGPLDSSLAKLKKLSVILLDDNNFSSQVPESFADLQNLTVLSLHGCNLSGSLPNKIFQVPTLKSIDLSNNELLQVSLPAEFPAGNGSALENLVLSFTQVGGKLPDSIGNLRMLSSLELVNCGLSGSIPDSIQNLTRLEYLNLAGNRLIGSIPSFQLSKRRLVQVHLQQNNLTGDVPSSHWEGLNKLEFLNLASNSLSGSFPESILTLKSLKGFDISNNSFSGQIRDSINVSSSQLDTIDMSWNKFHGPIPEFIFKLPLISNLVLSANNFNGSVDLDMFGKLKHLYSLELSYNDLKVNANTNGSAFSSLSRLNSLMLASCKMQEIPDVRNQSTLKMLDLSDNELSGEIPNWIWEAGNGYLRFLNLSHNRFSSLQKPYTFPFLLDVLDLHSNMLQGDIPVPPRRVYILDYSNNNFKSAIPVGFGNVLRSTLYFSISNSHLVGVIPRSLCNASRLDVLDLSNNSLNGTIPSCLAETTKTLRVLDVGRNNLTGNSLDVFPESCNLQTLDLSGNHFQGRLPQSLVNCEKLEVLNLGDNAITDTFPCWLSNLSNLHVFAIRSNKFYGNIDCLNFSGNWTNLQIIDIASNGFSGSLPPKFFASFQTNESKFSHLHFIHPANSAIYYQDSVTLTLKGQTTEIVKILTIFTSIDFSNNNFQGNIPVTVGDLKWLKLLNLSHNALTGPVPQSMGKMGNLESLDLSVNELSGTIPQQLASLTFLSLLNLSDNQLSGRIPGGPQFQTFTEASFRGNQGLCGLPLTKVCNNATSNVPTASTQTNEDSDYETGLYVSIGLGFLVGFVIIVGPFVFLRRWRNWYSNHVDRILARIDNKHTGMVINKNEHQDSTFY